MLPRMDVNGPRKVRAPQRACRQTLAWLLPIVLTALNRDCQDLFSIEKKPKRSDHPDGHFATVLFAFLYEAYVVLCALRQASPVVRPL